MVTLWGSGFPGFHSGQVVGINLRKSTAVYSGTGEATKLFCCMCVCVCVFFNAQPLSPVQLFVTPWTVAYQAPLPMEFPSFFFFLPH